MQFYNGSFIKKKIDNNNTTVLQYIAVFVYNRMAWQRTGALVEIRETLADIRGTTK